MKDFCNLPSFFSAMASCTSSRILSLALGLISLIFGPTEKHKREKNVLKLKSPLVSSGPYCQRSPWVIFCSVKQLKVLLALSPPPPSPLKGMLVHYRAPPSHPSPQYTFILLGGWSFSSLNTVIVVSISNSTPKSGGDHLIL